MVETKPTDASNLTGVILAGGLSKRFGSDKAAALLEGRPLLQWVASAVGEGSVVISQLHEYLKTSHG